MKLYYKKNIFILIISLIFTLFSSCQKVSINGNLDGQWQVMSVTPEPTDKPIDENIYYCFYLHVCNLTFYGDVFTTGNMIYNGDTLYLDFPYANSELSVIKLQQYGIDENPITFSVELLNKKSLILRHGDTVVTMRKF